MTQEEVIAIQRFVMATVRAELSSMAVHFERPQKAVQDQVEASAELFRLAVGKTEVTK